METKLLTPNMPRLETVKVPPISLGLSLPGSEVGVGVGVGVGVRARARAWVRVRG